jgi:hypothetical protein
LLEIVYSWGIWKFIPFHPGVTEMTAKNPNRSVPEIGVRARTMFTNQYPVLYPAWGLALALVHNMDWILFPGLHQPPVNTEHTTEVKLPLPCSVTPTFPLMSCRPTVEQRKEAQVGPGAFY